MAKRFQQLAIATTATTYGLIVVGALVRASGAGMGCPDWPRCFERWVPPTDLSQVPPALAPYFNVRLAWTEYLNRLLGMSTGLLVLATFVAALLFQRRNARVVSAAAGALVGVSVAGWLGRNVVLRNLYPSLVTVHMFVALATLFCLLYATLESARPRARVVEELTAPRHRLAAVSLFVTALALLQVAFGTRVRASLEHIAHDHPGLARGQWITLAGAADAMHRTLALAVVAACGALAAFVYRRVDAQPWLRRLAAGALALTLVQTALGVTLAYVALPPTAQVLHLAVATLLLFALVALHLLATRLPEGPAISTPEPISEPGHPTRS